MYYLIIPIKAGDNPDSWYEYLLSVGPIPIYFDYREAPQQHIVLRFTLAESAVHLFDDNSVFDRKQMILNFSFIPANQVRFELCKNPADEALVRLTTGHFLNWAWRVRINYPNKSLSIGRKSYFLLCSGLFKSPPVSICRKPDKREILYYNEGSATLNDCYEGLQTRGLQKGEHFIGHNLECVIHFVHGVFEHKSLDKIPSVLNHPKNKTLQLEGPQPCEVKVVNLKRFINEGIGVCRHNAMLVCYLLRRLQIDGWIPEGEIIHFRMTLKKIGHSFVLFRTTNHQEIYVIDSTHQKVYFLPHAQAEFTRHYNPELYSEIRTRYLLSPPTEPTLSIPEDDFAPSRTNTLILQSPKL